MRLKLRAWLHLEDVRKTIQDAAREGNRDGFVSSMYTYISAAFSISVEELTQCFWKDVAEAYVLSHNFNAPKINLPLIKPRRIKPKDKPTEGWDYPERTWYMWANIIAERYGWTLEYIAELDVDDAFALIQEIFVDDQMRREWEWSLSDNAYSYDQNTKKSRFHELPRPDWMQPQIKSPDETTVRIRKDELPVGIVLRWVDGKPTKSQ